MKNECDNLHEPISLLANKACAAHLIFPLPAFVCQEAPDPVCFKHLGLTRSRPLHHRTETSFGEAPEPDGGSGTTDVSIPSARVSHVKTSLGSRCNWITFALISERTFRRRPESNNGNQYRASAPGGPRAAQHARKVCVLANNHF